MVAFDQISDLKTELIRKTIGGSVFIAPENAPLLTSLTAVTGTAPNQIISLAEIPDAYKDLGHLTDDGMAFSTESTTSDITSFQSTTPTRSDITAETSTLTVQAQETKLQTLALYTGAVESGITPAAGTGEVSIAKPSRPSSRFYRVLALAIDGEGDDEIYIARYLPRAKVTGRSEQGYSKTDQALLWGVTFTGYRDSAAGTAERYIFGGPGWFKLLASMGFDVTP